ncbi:MAG: DUF2147 domain-containing protein [Bacteroidota bacterium]
MKMPAFLLALALCLMSYPSLIAQDNIVGIWKTVNEEGETESHVEIFEKSGKFYGKVVKLISAEEGSICDKCPDEKKDQPILGLEILWGLKSYKDYWSYGKIMDPNNGKTYKCSIWLKSPDQLTVRGYIGISALGRSQTWYRV